MAMDKRILSAITNCKLGETIILDYKLESGTGMQEGEVFLHVWVRPRHGQDELYPFCHKHCSGYDSQTEERTLRGMDLGGVQVLLHSSTRRVYCECCQKTVTAEVPWAFYRSGFTKEFDLTVTYMALQASKSMISQYMRCAWHTVMQCISRAKAFLEPDGTKRYNNLVNIGIDETSFRKGYKYLTVVVNHDTNEVVWAHEGHGIEILKMFFEELCEEQRNSIRTVSGDGARWIDTVMQEYIPNATRCMDSFHVVEWAIKALDEVRLTCRKETVKKFNEEKKKSEPSEKEIAKHQKEVDAINGSKYAVGKAVENLTENQENKLYCICLFHPKVFRASALKEMLRKALQINEPHEAEKALNSFFWRATHSRREPFKQLAYKIRRHQKAILNTIKTRISNARVEANNNKIKLIIRRGFGYRNIQNLIDMILLCCSKISIPLPNRSGTKPKAA